MPLDLETLQEAIDMMNRLLQANLDSKQLLDRCQELIHALQDKCHLLEKENELLRGKLELSENLVDNFRYKKKG